MTLRLCLDYDVCGIHESLYLYCEFMLVDTHLTSHVLIIKDCANKLRFLFFFVDKIIKKVTSFRFFKRNQIPILVFH